MHNIIMSYCVPLHADQEEAMENGHLLPMCHHIRTAHSFQQGISNYAGQVNKYFWWFGVINPNPIYVSGSLLCSTPRRRDWTGSDS